VIVLDTHILVWLAAASERLGSAAREALSGGSELAISTVSIQEIAYLVTSGRVGLDRPLKRWVTDVLSVHDIRPIAPSVSVALRAGSLDGETFPGDPADRLIYATAVEHDAQLATADARLRAADPARVAW
jgi:PIN domain nuclease of toxin-antitoxin system